MSLLPELVELVPMLGPPSLQTQEKDLCFQVKDSHNQYRETLLNIEIMLSLVPCTGIYTFTTTAELIKKKCLEIGIPDAVQLKIFTCPGGKF